MTKNEESTIDKAALRGEPSYVWRSGQERRLQMILEAGEDRVQGKVLENGCGIGMYLEHISPHAGVVYGLEYDFARAVEAHNNSEHIIISAGEDLPFPSDSFDLILSHEVIEHVEDDKVVVGEMVRVLRTGGRIIIFCPNRGYPFETHGIFWRGHYHFGNIPLINYLPRKLRDLLAPHVRVHNRRDLKQLFSGLPVYFIERKIIFGGYDNIVSKMPRLGRLLRIILHRLERTPLSVFGLSHFWVIEKVVSV